MDVIDPVHFLGPLDDRNIEILAYVSKLATEHLGEVAPGRLEPAIAIEFHRPKRVAAPYMILSFDTTERWKDIAAAIHPFDRTARPQLVSAKWNPSYHRVISEFEKLTGVGAVLNTSFNLHGFPICSRPADALEVLDKSGLTHLAIENWLVEKV